MVSPAGPYPAPVPAAAILAAEGRLDWGRLRRSAVRTPVADAGLLVATRADTWALRRQFKVDASSGVYTRPGARG